MKMGCQWCRILGPAWMVIMAYIKYRWGLGVGITKHSAAVPILPVEVWGLLPV